MPRGLQFRRLTRVHTRFGKRRRKRVDNEEKTSARFSDMDRRETFLLLGGLFVSACTAGEDFVKPTIDLPSKYPLQAGGGARRNDQKWWLAFNDRLLNELIVVGLKQNLDIRRALALGLEIRRALGPWALTHGRWAQELFVLGSPGRFVYGVPMIPMIPVVGVAVA